MNVYTKNELASVQGKISLLIPAGYFTANKRKEASSSLSKLKKNRLPSTLPLMHLPWLLHPEILL